MKPLYDYFESSQSEHEKFVEKRAVIHKENPEAWKTIDEICPAPKENLVMNTLVPHDDEYRAIEASGKYLLSPQVEFYGTKWDFDFTEANVNEIGKERITFGPQTAWSPPSQFCQKLAIKYGVEVMVEYDEPGIGFIGKEIYGPGGEVEEEIYENYLEGTYILQNDMFWENEVESYMTQDKEDGKTFEEILQDMFSFITDEKEIKQLKEVYDDIEVEVNE
jgi:hypothetical protein